MAASPLVTADWLQTNLEAPDIRVVDATWFAPFTNPSRTGHEAYMDAHIPGAVFFDIDTVADAEAPYPHTFPPAHVFSARVRKLGLGDGNRIVVYDQNNFFAGARVWWMFRTLGHDDIFVLDGGLDAWRVAGSETEDLPPVAVERHFTPRVRSDLLKTTEQMARLVEAGTHQIIDARPPGRFEGSVPEPREGLPSGHMPNSINVPGGALITEDGRMKSPEALSTVFADAGVDPMAPTVTSCGSGVTAALAALALAQLGNDLVAVYDGSWAEWAARGDLPIKTGTAP